MPELWTKDKEFEFFEISSNLVTIQQLFYYGEDFRYYAYWPKSYKGGKSTLQSRNALIGNFTEKFVVDLLQDFAKSRNLYAIQGAICDQIGLTSKSPADVVLCRENKTEQRIEDIIAIFEVKMSIVWNWEYTTNGLKCLGDFKTHQGNPGLLRSDSMLKAIGKSINIRVSGYGASHIPIVILGNTPITEYYTEKVDHLLIAGIIQGFWSLNTKPLDDNIETLKQTDKKGFVRIDSYCEFLDMLDKLLIEKQNFFSAMKTKNQLGKIIEIASQERSLESKAEKFLELIKV
ncbi:conserved hypothetical protein [Desulfamplus magnetovallimortis]|uniref:Uncharacterized protein n=1 Tax=Desulfamplus magnetovallimortis TaxID=1246637 RepID=A0A1W1H7E1_9BACT|nr:hypothetical protein [Desulfamplus magnetovallimortis]SLM28354.1 conserved hypothetical protein [Desulfamplus magnetovallimortis]